MTLDLGENDLTNEGVHCLKDALMRNHTLRNLNLYSCQITSEGAVALAEYIADNPTLETMDLKNNSIEIGGLMALTHSMKINKSVTNLGLNPNMGTPPDDLQKQHQELLSQLSDYCGRNTEIHEEKKREAKERAAEEAQSVEKIQDEVLSEPVSRLLSLWSHQPIPRRTSSPPSSYSACLPPPITVSSVAESPSESACSGWQAVRGTSHCLRSPQPSPTSSPIPSPTRSRFRVTRVFQDANTDGRTNGVTSCPPVTTSSTSTTRPSPVGSCGRFGRFKFTVTPVKTINGVDSKLPPLPDINITKNGYVTRAPADDTSSTSPLLSDASRSSEDDSLSQDQDDSTDNDSVFLDSPVAAAAPSSSTSPPPPPPPLPPPPPPPLPPPPVNRRVRHDSMTFYRKKRDKDVRRSNSLPETLLDSPRESLSALQGKRWADDSHAELIYSSRTVDSTFLLDAKVNGLKESRRENVADVVAVMRLEVNLQTGDDRERHHDGGSGVVKDSGDIHRFDTIETECRELVAKGECVVMPTEEAVTGAFSDRDDTSSIGDRDSGIYLLDSTGDELEVPPSDVYGPGDSREPLEHQPVHVSDGYCCDNSGSAVKDHSLTPEGADTSIGARLEPLEDAFPESGTDIDSESRRREVGVITDDDSSRLSPDNVDDVEPPVIQRPARVSFSLVDIDDNYATFVQQQDYSRAWVMTQATSTTLSSSPSEFGKSPSSSSLDLLTGDDDDDGVSSHTWHHTLTDTCTDVDTTADLMFFCDPGTPVDDLETKESLVARGDQLTSDGNSVSDLVTMWVNDQAHISASDDGSGDGTVNPRDDDDCRSDGDQRCWTNTTPPSSRCAGQVTAEKNVVTLARRVALEGSESSNSSDSGVPESPVSCSPPPPDRNGGPCSHGGNMGLDLLVPLFPNRAIHRRSGSCNKGECVLNTVSFTSNYRKKKSSTSYRLSVIDVRRCDRPVLVLIYAV